MMDTTAKLLDDIERYILRHGLTASEFGVEALNDTAFVHRLRRGRSPSGRTIDKVRNYMARTKKVNAA